MYSNVLYVKAPLCPLKVMAGTLEMTPSTLKITPWYLKNDTWYLRNDTWYLKNYTWYLKYDTLTVSLLKDQGGLKIQYITVHYRGTVHF